jgi:hypothetical protein
LVFNMLMTSEIANTDLPLLGTQKFLAMETAIINLPLYRFSAYIDY